MGQKRVHADSLQMIPDSEKRLAKAIQDLEELVVRSNGASSRAASSEGGS